MVVRAAPPLARARPPRHGLRPAPPARRRKCGSSSRRTRPTSACTEERRRGIRGKARILLEPRSKSLRRVRAKGAPGGVQGERAGHNPLPSPGGRPALRTAGRKRDAGEGPRRRRDQRGGHGGDPRHRRGAAGLGENDEELIHQPLVLLRASRSASAAGPPLGSSLSNTAGRPLPRAPSSGPTPRSWTGPDVAGLRGVSLAPVAAPAERRVL